MSNFSYKIIPIFTDNYIFTLTSNSQDETLIIVDPGEATTLIKTLDLRSDKKPKIKILITHHHPDHIGGLKELTEKFSCEIWGPQVSQNKVPEIQHGLKGKEHLSVGEFSFEVLQLPGHTLDHLGFYEASRGWLFCGDVLFHYGCGRLFEGDFSMAFQSLQKIKTLPDSTLIFCTHEYTEKNLEFSLSWAKQQQNTALVKKLEYAGKKIKELRRKAQPTIPFQLGEEKNTNPFLLAKTVQEFKDIRLERNHFN